MNVFGLIKSKWDVILIIGSIAGTAYAGLNYLYEIQQSVLDTKQSTMNELYIVKDGIYQIQEQNLDQKQAYDAKFAKLEQAQAVFESELEKIKKN